MRPTTSYKIRIWNIIQRQSFTTHYKFDDFCKVLFQVCGEAHSTLFQTLCKVLYLPKHGSKQHQNYTHPLCHCTYQIVIAPLKIRKKAK